MPTWLGKRRRILVDSIQYRLLAVNLIYFFTILIIFAATLFLPLILQLRSDVLSLSQRHEVASQFLSLHTSVWPAILTVFVLLAIHSVFFSHRIAGPLYRFRITLKAVTGGDLTVRANIRTHDYLHKDADIINGMIANLNTRIKGIQEQSGAVSVVLSHLRAAIDTGSVEKIGQNIESLQTEVEKLNASLDQFTTEKEEARENNKFTDNNVPASLPESASITST